jgi:hypothetical protein
MKDRVTEIVISLFDLFLFCAGVHVFSIILRFKHVSRYYNSAKLQMPRHVPTSLLVQEYPFFFSSFSSKYSFWDDDTFQQC